MGKSISEKDVIDSWELYEELTDFIDKKNISSLVVTAALVELLSDSIFYIEHHESIYVESILQSLKIIFALKLDRKKENS